MKYFIAVFVTAIVVFLGATVYYKGLPTFPQYSKNSASTQSGIPVSSQETMPSPQATVTPAPTDESAILIAAIKAALVVKHGPDAESLNVMVSKIEGDYATGGASAQGGGGMWLAAKVNGDWKLVWDGNGQINCSDLALYPVFPNDLVSECWDTVNLKIIKR